MERRWFAVFAGIILVVAASFYLPVRGVLALVGVALILVIAALSEELREVERRARWRPRHPVRAVYDFSFHLRDAAWKSIGIDGDDVAQMASVPVGFTLEVWVEPIRHYRISERIDQKLVERSYVSYDEDWQEGDIIFWQHSLTDGSTVNLYLPGEFNRRSGAFEIVFARRGGSHPYGTRSMDEEHVPGGLPWQRSVLFRVAIPDQQAFRSTRERDFPELENLRVPSDPPGTEWPCYVRTSGHEEYESRGEDSYYWRLVVRDLRPIEGATVVRIKRSWWQREIQAIFLRLDDGRRLVASPGQIEPRDDGRIVPFRNERVVAIIDQDEMRTTSLARLWLTGIAA